MLRHNFISQFNSSMRKGDIKQMEIGSYGIRMKITKSEKYLAIKPNPVNIVLF